jgi:hypothetical protein
MGRNIVVGDGQDKPQDFLSFAVEQNKGLPRRSKFKVGNVSLASGYGLESGSGLGLGSVLGLGCLELGLEPGYGWIGVEELVLELSG